MRQVYHTVCREPLRIVHRYAEAAAASKELQIYLPFSRQATGTSPESPKAAGAGTQRRRPLPAVSLTAMRLSCGRWRGGRGAWSSPDR